MNGKIRNMIVRTTSVIVLSVARSASKSVQTVLKLSVLRSHISRTPYCSHNY